jgi:lysozyme family protein
MAADYDIARPGLIRREGEFSDDPDDTGGATRWGATEQDAREDGYKGDMKNFPLEWAIRLHKKKYWDKTGICQLNDQEIASRILDVAVNMGVGILWIPQRVLNAMNWECKDKEKGIYGYKWPELKVDAVLGPVTTGIINNLNDHERELLLKGICSWQIVCYCMYTEHKNSQRKFYRGGWNGRVDIEVPKY